MKFKPVPKQYRMNPKNWEGYKKAFEWLLKNDPLEILDALMQETGEDPEEVYTEFSTVYMNYTDPKDYSGFYSPLRWAERAAFVYGYLSGREDEKRERTA